MEYRTRGICASRVRFDVEDGKVRNVDFYGGCDGNHSGISALIEGMDVDEAISRLEGIKCGPRATSCPDQLAQALKQYKGGNIQ